MHPKLFRHCAFAIASTCAFPQTDVRQATSEIRIYFVPWSTRMDIRATPERIRKQAGYKLTFNNPWDIDSFLDKLPTGKMEPCKESSADIRLVIDIISQNGAIASYYASKFRMFTGDFKRSVVLTKQFLDMFDLEKLNLFKPTAPNPALNPDATSAI